VLTGGAGADTLTGNAGNDTLIGGAGNDVLAGGSGMDTVDYSTSGAGVTVNLSAGTLSGGDAQGDSFSSIENVTGSGYNDTLTGDANANVLAGGAGADTLTGNAGNDTLIGGAGVDYLDGGAGSDTFHVGLGLGNDQILGGAGGGWTDVILVQNVSAGPGAGGWTVFFGDGSEIASDAAAHGTIDVGPDATGTIVFSDGGETTFQGIERFQW